MRERATREERILVVEDEEPIRDLVTTALRFTGFTVETAATGPEGLALARNDAWHVLVLDVNLPGLDGFSLCRKLRESGDEVPVIFLTARDDPADLREGFTGGGDDYLTKPFSLEELVLRVEAMLRRGERLSGVRLLNESFDIDDLHIDLPARQVSRGEEVITLTSREFDLLAFLAANAGQTFSKADLLRRVWGWDFGDTSTVTVHVRRLREKIEPDPSNPTYVQTVWGVGYRFGI